MTTINYTTFDIVGFIEKNPLSRLNIEYQNALINKIKSEFNGEEQKLFVTSFYCYLNFNPLTDFVIDFDDVWKWCGFSRKDHAKRILEKHFTEDTDYKVALPNLGERKNEGGFNKEKITLNIRTFKKYCLKSNTEKSNEIHDYYIKLEEILQDTLLEQTDELKLQLEQKEALIEFQEEENLKQSNRIKHLLLKI
jgi:phage anti-repressor protein